MSSKSSIFILGYKCFLSIDDEADDVRALKSGPLGSEAEEWCLFSELDVHVNRDAGAILGDELRDSGYNCVSSDLEAKKTEVVVDIVFLLGEESSVEERVDSVV